MAKFKNVAGIERVATGTLSSRELLERIASDSLFYIRMLEIDKKKNINRKTLYDIFKNGSV